jgi:hypothetical protein
VYLLVFHKYINEMHGSRSKIPSKKSRPYIYDVKFLALLGFPYTHDISRLRVKRIQTTYKMKTSIFCDRCHVDLSIPEQLLRLFSVLRHELDHIRVMFNFVESCWVTVLKYRSTGISHNIDNSTTDKIMASCVIVFNFEMGQHVTILN